jgi:4-hydroxy-3-polyprenylbenzoate decarboxylase
MATTVRGYNDLHEHLAALKAKGLLREVDAPVNKDSELHPLVRWQFVGGIEEKDRKAFLFNNVVDGKGKRYDIPVVVGALAANTEIYATGMGVAVEGIQEKWDKALAAPIAPRAVNHAPCQEIVIEGEALKGAGKGLETLPIPVSTPGFDSAPTLTATNVITKDPDSGVQNMGTYRAGFKASDRLVVRMATRLGGAGGYLHWQKYKKRGEKMPCAIVVGCPPYVAYVAPAKVPLDMDEMAIAGGLAGKPINIVRGRTVDLMVPAEAELVIEGLIDPEWLEPEGPFGESHGHVALEEFNMPMQVTAITRRKDAVITSYISQVTPSESSLIKKVAYEPMFLNHLARDLNIRGVTRVTMHERLSGLLRITLLSFKRGSPRTEVWRAMYAAAAYRSDWSKIVIALSEDIDPENSDSVMWAMAYRINPVEDVKTLGHRAQGHGPKREHTGEEDSTLLIDATMKSDMPPLALPGREYMESAKKLWEKLGLPALRPESPWHGYSLGDWTEEWAKMAKRAADSDWVANGADTLKRQKKGSGFPPETGVREVEDWSNKK